ncbi:MAG TPA: hypothetical protein VN758_01490 [Solirubrobacterales bacterium]|nr:hypothetical protein [Solirubrobacterales bacterium]
MQSSQASDEPVRPLAEAAETVIDRLRSDRGHWVDNNGCHFRLRLKRDDARPLGEIGRTPGLINGVKRRRADLRHRGLGGAGGCQGQINALLELANQRRSRLLGEQPLLCAVVPSGLHPP